MDFHLNLNTEAVEHVYASDPICLEPKTSLRDVFRLMQKQRRGAVLVCRDEQLVGIFTERDALKLMAGDADLDVPVEQVMTNDPVALSDSDTVGKAIAKMSYGGYRRLPIVDADGRPKGFLKVSSILHYLVQHFPEFVYNLPPTPHHTTQEREGA